MTDLKNFSKTLKKVESWLKVQDGVLRKKKNAGEDIDVVRFMIIEDAQEDIDNIRKELKRLEQSITRIAKGE